MAGIALTTILCVLCFFSYWFLQTDAYFAHARKAKGKVTQVVYGDNSNEGIQYRVHFKDNNGKTRDALSAWYEKNNVVKEDDSVDIKYVSFRAGWKPVLAVRVQNDELVNHENFRIFMVAGIIFAVIAVLNCIQFGIMF